MNLLVVEDNRSLVSNILDYFESRGHRVDAAPDGVTGLHLANTKDYDAMILDVMMPRMDGFEVLKQVRSGRRPGLPILMLTARDDLPYKIAGFQAGADDYLTKPFALAELLARLGAMVGRARNPEPSKKLCVGDLTFDLSTLDVQRAGDRIHLYPACLRVLEVLMKASPAVVSKGQLEDAIWSDGIVSGDMLRTHIYELRRRIDAPYPIKLIQTLPRVGYRISLQLQGREA